MDCFGHVLQTQFGSKDSGNLTGSDSCRGWLPSDIVQEASKVPERGHRLDPQFTAPAARLAGTRLHSPVSFYILRRPAHLGDFIVVSLPYLLTAGDEFFWHKMVVAHLGASAGVSCRLLFSKQPVSTF